jgi:Flp pilus assembly pilin Flp
MSEIVGGGSQARARDQRGASLAEYVILVALIAVVVLISVKVLGQTTSSKWSSTTSEVGTW